MNRLIGKDKFLVKDLINILQKQDQDMEVMFGAMDGNYNTCFVQDENFIFDVREDFSKELVFYIITKTEL